VRALALSIALVACAGKQNGDDVFVAGGSAIAAWAASADGRVRVPLAQGLGWQAPTVGSGADSTLFKVRGDVGPTFVVAARIDDAPRPLALHTCAAAHAERIAKAVSSANVFTSPPTISDERRRGERVPRVHYVAPLDAASGARAAAAITWWTYFLDRDRCVGVGVTGVVREHPTDPRAPDPEDMHRLERVFSLVLDGTVIAD
jgi:hypothetical protein